MYTPEQIRLMAAAIMRQDFKPSTHSALWHEGIRHFSELLLYSESELMRIPYIGKLAVDEMSQALAKLGFKTGELWRFKAQLQSCERDYYEYTLFTEEGLSALINSSSQTPDPDEMQKLKAFLLQPVAALGKMSVRLEKAITAQGISLVGHLYAREPAHFMRVLNVGEGTLHELRATLARNGVPWESLQYKNPEKVFDEIWDGQALNRSILDAVRLEAYLVPENLILAGDTDTLDADSLILMQLLPDETKQNLSRAFLASVVGSPEIKNKVRALLVYAVQSTLDKKGGPA